MCWLCHSPLPDKEDYFVCLFIVAFLSTTMWVFSLAIPHGIHLVIPTHPTFFWVVCHPSRTSPQKNLSRNPRIDFPFSPPPDHTLSYLWPMTHHSCIGWVQIGSAWALCVKSLSAAHAFAMVWRLIYVFCHSSLTFYGVNCFSDFPFFTGLLLSRAGPCLIVGFPFFELILCSFRNLVAISIILLCYSCRGVI